MPEQRHDIDRISHYSKNDYIIGETSQDVLQSIADRLINGPTPVGTLPELDSSELESEMAELSRQKSANAEVWGDFGAAELETTPIARFLPGERMNWPLGEASGSRLSGVTPTSHRSGPFREPDDLQADGDDALHGATAQATTTDGRWQQAYSMLTHEGSPSREQYRF